MTNEELELLLRFVEIVSGQQKKAHPQSNEDKAYRWESISLVC